MTMTGASAEASSARKTSTLKFPSSTVKFPSSLVEFPSSRLTDMYMLGCTEHPFDMAENVLSKCLDL